MSTVLKLISNINNVTNYKLDGRAICRGAAKLSQPKNAQKKCKINRYTDMQMYRYTLYRYANVQQLQLTLVVEDSCLLLSL